jgi:hypothetical protein
MALDLTDKTANGNTLTNHGATEVTTSLPFAQSTEAVDLVAASSQYLGAADSATLDITGNLTIECWVKFSSTTPADTIWTLVGKMGAAGNRSYQLTFQDEAGTKYIRFTGSSDGTTLVHVRVTWTPTNSTWYHVAVVYTAAGGTADFYINGAQQGTQQSGLPTSLFNSSAEVQIGAFNAASQFFDGKFDDVRIWAATRTSTQINNNKSVELAGTESGLNAYWPFEASLGSESFGRIITFI